MNSEKQDISKSSKIYDIILKGILAYGIERDKYDNNFAFRLHDLIDKITKCHFEIISEDKQKEIEDAMLEIRKINPDKEGDIKKEKSWQLVKDQLIGIPDQLINDLHNLLFAIFESEDRFRHERQSL